MRPARSLPHLFVGLWPSGTSNDQLPCFFVSALSSFLFPTVAIASLYGLVIVGPSTQFQQFFARWLGLSKVSADWLLFFS